MNQLQAYQLMHQGIIALTRAEQQGMRIDMDYVERKKSSLTNKISQLERDLMETDFVRHWHHVYGHSFNLNSDRQLSHILYHIKKIKPPKQTENGQGSTDEEALRQLNIPELNQLLTIRKFQKLKDTYLDNFTREQVNGYIHPFFNLHTVRTYRSSCDRPNFQNIPKRDKESMTLIRKAIYPRPGHQLIEVDFSKLEVSIAACYHKDPVMMNYLTSDHNDMHADVAEQIFFIKYDKKNSNHKTLRNAAKNGFVFPQFYGDYYVNCGNNLMKWVNLHSGKWKSGQGLLLTEDLFISDLLIQNRIKSSEDFINHVKSIEQDFWNNRFRTYSSWKNKWYKKYQNQGYIDMLTGFRCGGVMRKNEVINYPVQGSAFHCLLWSFIELDRIMLEEQWDTRLIGQIHDAIILDVHPDEFDHVVKTVVQVTTQDLPKAWKWIIVPLQVEVEVCPVDASWAEKQEYHF